jgi:purine-binding chemotaxis protein CheW
MTQQSTNAASAPKGGRSGVSQYVTFHCAGVEYGIEILSVQEIRGWGGVTEMPRTPPHILGVMNLRGLVVPVVDLRSRFGLEARPFDHHTVVIVVGVEGGSELRTVGIVVDGVSEVRNFTAEDMKPAPDMSQEHGEDCVSSLAVVEDRMVMLLDLHKLVGASAEPLPRMAAAS